MPEDAHVKTLPSDCQRSQAALAVLEERLNGLILPADSPLVQFEIQRYADGVVEPPLPLVVWVDRAKPLRSDGTGIACGCTGPFYPIRNTPGAIFARTIPGHTPSVCLCMGSFIE